MAAGFAGLLLVSCTQGTQGNASAPTTSLPGATTSAPTPKVVDERSYLTIRPVVDRLPPPCPMTTDAQTPATVLPEILDAVTVGCLQVGTAVVDAKDVSSAKVLANPNAGTWEVHASLSADATARMSALARLAGIGGQFAIVVDGAVANAPKWGTTDFPGIVSIAGTDQASAEGLANRLNHP